MKYKTEMNVEVKTKKSGFAKWIWGTFLLLAAALVLANQLGGFEVIGIGSIIAAALALAIIFQCLFSLTFAPLPIPVAALYYIFQTPLNLPPVSVWVLILAAVLASIGLGVLLPEKKRHRKHQYEGCRPEMHAEDGGDTNNPCVSVQFGSVSRYLRSENLETATLNCKFGALEVFFDQVQLSPNGAEMICNCSFGSIELFVPKEWKVVDKLNCTLGGVEYKGRHSTPEENSPQLTITGNISFGGVEIRSV